MAGEFTVRVSNSYNFGNQTIGGVTGTVNPNKVDGFSQEIPANKTLEPISFNLDPTAVMILGVEADQDCTFRCFDDAGTPALITDIGATGVFSLKKSQPIFWRINDVGNCPLDGAGHSPITLIKVTTGTTKTVFKVSVGLDATAGI